MVESLPFEFRCCFKLHLYDRKMFLECPSSIFAFHRRSKVYQIIGITSLCLYSTTAFCKFQVGIFHKIYIRKSCKSQNPSKWIDKTGCIVICWLCWGGRKTALLMPGHWGWTWLESVGTHAWKLDRCCATWRGKSEGAIGLIIRAIFLWK